MEMVILVNCGYFLGSQFIKCVLLVGDNWFIEFKIMSNGFVLLIGKLLIRLWKN